MAESDNEIKDSQKLTFFLKQQSFCRLGLHSIHVPRSSRKYFFSLAIQANPFTTERLAAF